MEKVTMFSLGVIFLLNGCIKKTEENCFDGIQNQLETNTDCGGSCKACFSCSDHKLNQGETSIDCGGPCVSCPFTWTDNKGVSFSTDSSAYDILQKKLTAITGAGYLKSSELIAIVFNSNTTVGVGTFSTSAITLSLSSYSYDSGGNLWGALPYPITEGFVTLSSVDSNKMSGTFSFSLSNFGDTLFHVRDLNHISGSFQGVKMH